MAIIMQLYAHMAWGPNLPIAFFADFCILHFYPPNLAVASRK